MQKVLRHTVIIEFSHYVQRKLLFLWFKLGVFEPHFGAYSRCERRYPYVKGCNSGASQKILWEQVVTCSGHSKKHFITNLAEYWGGGGVCTVGQITSRTTGWCLRITKWVRGERDTLDLTMTRAVSDTTTPSYSSHTYLNLSVQVSQLSLHGPILCRSCNFLWYLYISHCPYWSPCGLTITWWGCYGLCLT